MESGFELFDHTADMGIRVEAKTREALVWPAALGLYAAFGELIACDRDHQAFHFQASAPEDAVLLRDFLAELLILFERDHRILSSITSIHFPAGTLEVSGISAPVDPNESVFLREVKAVTYHGLELREIAGGSGFEAKFIVDI